MTNDDFGDAIKEAFGGVIKTAIIYLILRQTSTNNDLLAFTGINALADIVIISVFDLWGISYLIGWLVASGILTAFGLLNQDVFTLYLIVGGLIILGNISKKKNSSKKRRKNR